MTYFAIGDKIVIIVSTHMPLARHDAATMAYGSCTGAFLLTCLLRGMTPLDRDKFNGTVVSTHMPLARHDCTVSVTPKCYSGFYSHASCEA